MPTPAELAVLAAEYAALTAVAAVESAEAAAALAAAVAKGEEYSACLDEMESAPLRAEGVAELTPDQRKRRIHRMTRLAERLREMCRELTPV